MSYYYDDDFENDSQPKFNEKIMEQHKSMYPAYRHQEKASEDPVEASEKLISWANSEQYKKFAALFGEEMAFKMCNKIVSQAIEGAKE